MAITGNDLLSKYEERKKKKKEESQGSTEGVTGEQLLKKYETHKRYKTTDTSGVDEKYLNTFMSDANSFFSGVGDYSISYTDANSRLQDLGSRYDTIQAYLYQNKGKLDEKSYSSLSSAFDDFTQKYNGAAEFYGKFENEDSYNAWKSRKELLSGVDSDPEFDSKSSTGWSKYLSDKEAWTHEALSGKEGETFWEKLGRWYGSGGVVDTTLPMSTTTQVQHAMRDEAATDRATGRPAFEPRNDWTDEQKAIYGYLYETDRAAAEEYAKYATEDNELEAIKRIQEKATSSLGAGILNTAGAIATAPMGMADFLNDLVKQDFSDDGTISPFEYSQAVTEGISTHLNEKGGTLDEDIPIIGGKGWGDVYGLGTSIIQSMASAYTLGPGGTLVAYFGQGAAAGADEAKKRGAEDWQATLYGMAVGVFEGIAESLGIDNLFKLGGTTTLKGVILNILKQAGAEGAEEGLTALFSNIADNAIMGDKSTFYALVEQYMASGMSESDAKTKAWLDSVEGIAFDTIAGAVSGGVSGGIHTTTQSVIDNTQAKKLYGNSAMELTQEALELDQDNKFAQKMYDRLDSGKTLSGAQLNRLAQHNQDILVGNDVTAIQSATEERLKSLGETGDVTAIAKALAKWVQGQELSKSEKKAISNSKFGKRVANEMNPENIRSGGYSSAWAEKIGTDKIHSAEYSKAIATDEETEGVTENATAHDIAVQAILEGSESVPETAKVEENVEVKEISSVKDGEVMVKLDGGEVVNAREANLTTETEGLLYEAVAQMSEDPEIRMDAVTANDFVKGYDPNAGVSVGEYIHGFKDAFLYGAYGFAESELDRGVFTSRLSEIQRRTAHGHGKMVGQERATEKQAKIDSTVAEKTAKNATSGSKKGKVYRDFGTKTLNARQKQSLKALEVVAESLGVDIHVFESAVGKDGKRVGANGWFDPADNSIHIDLYAGASGESTMLFTAAHELTHFIREWSPAKFKTFADFLLEQYGEKGVSVEQLVQRQIEKAKRNGRDIDFDTAYEEVVADSCEAMLTDSNAMEKIALLKAQDKSLWSKIKSFIQDLMAKINKVYQGLNPDSLEANYVREMQEAAEKLYEMWTEALVDAGESYNAASEIVENDIANKDILFNQRAAESHKTKLAEKYTKDASVSLDVLMQRYNKILGVWDELGGELNSKFLNEWNSKVGKDRAFTVFKAQAGYKYNVELSSMCKKGVPLFEAIDTIVKNEVMKELDTKVLGKEEKEILYDILKSHSFEIPCAICYVEQARQREGVIIDNFLNGKVEQNNKGETTTFKLGWNQVLKSIEKEMKASGVDYTFKAVDRSIATDKYVPQDLTMDSATQEAFYNALKKIANEEITRYNQAEGKKRKLVTTVTPSAIKEVFKGTLPSNLKIFKVLFTDPTSRFTIESDLLYSSMTTHNLSTGHNALYSLFNSQGGVSGYKTKQGTVVYWGDILGKKWTPSTVRDEGGIRNQSNSDFQMYTLLDQVQMYIDFTAKGYYLQAYTKVLSELKLFGLSRGKINASLIPAVHEYRNADGSVDVETTRLYAGLDQNGNLLFDDIEGINHEEAFMLLEDAEYSKSIGGICIGYSDNHILKLLDDNRVQQIIGFHDKTDDPTKRYRGARYARNYNGLNEAIDNEGKTVHIGFNPYVRKAEKIFTFNAKTETYEGQIVHNGKTYVADDIPKLAADLYLEMCEKKGYTPAYTDFDWHENYYKLLSDFSLYDSQGHYAPHRKVAYQMPDQVPYLDHGGNKKYMATKDYIKSELAKELKVRDSIGEALADTSEDGIIPQFKKRVNELHSNKEKLSDRESPADMDVQNSFEVKSLNDYIGVQKAVIGTLVREGFFSDEKNTVVNKDSGMVVEITKDGIRETLGKGNRFQSLPRRLKELKLATIRSLPHLIETAELVTDDVLNVHDPNSKVKYAYLRTDADIQEANGRGTYTVTITVRKSPQKNKFWMHEVRITKKDQGLSSGGDVNPQQEYNKTLDPKDILPQDSDSVKRKFSDRDTLGNTLSEEQQAFFKDSKVRDKKGNLMVLYHGTTANFNTFKRGDVGFHFGTKGAARGRVGFGKNVILKEVYLNITNPIVFDEDLGSWDADHRLTRELYDKGILSIEEAESVLFTDDKAYRRSTEAANKKLASLLLSKGYDGIAYRNTFETKNATTSYIVFESNQVKEISNKNPSKSGDIRYSDRDSYAPTFYSHMGKVVDGIKSEKVGATGVVPYLKGKGVKAEEIKWSGIEAWLEGKKSVTKAALQEFVAGSQLQIVEELGEGSAKITLERSPYGDDSWDVLKGGEVVDTYSWSEESGLYESDMTGGGFATKDRLLEYFQEKYESGNTRWEKYKIDGGTHYRELVFRLPDSSYNNQAMRVHWGEDAEGVLVHARMQDMTTKDGKKMLFIEELQSDWHNEGLESGYVEESDFARIDKLQEKADDAFYAVEDYSMEMTGYAGEWETIEKTPKGAKLLKAYREAKAAYDQAMDASLKKIPDAPFRNNYHEFVLKRLVRMAAEEGYDSIGWTPSEIQSERWSDEFEKAYRIEYDQDMPSFMRKYGKKWGATVEKTMLDQGMRPRDEELSREHLAYWQDELAHDDGESADFIQSQIDRIQNHLEKTGETVWSMDIPDSMKESVLYEGQVLYSDRVIDPETLDFLNKQKPLRVYRAMQVIDGELYPPMAAKVKSENGKKTLVTPSKIGAWEQAVERPDLIRNGNKFELDKANGSSIEAAYNPYFHTSASPLNDQFSSAYKRPNLVIVEGEIPMSELTSGYRAEFAKDTVGETKWHSGVVASKLKGEKARKVYLSRWFKPVRIVPDAEVASIVAGILEGENIDIPYNVVTPSLRSELEKLGVSIMYQDRDPDSVSNRSLLAGALDSVAQNDIERAKLAQYKQKIETIQSEESKLRGLREQIKELSFAKGPKDTAKIRGLQNEATRIANRINTFDRQLLTLEASAPLKAVLEREKTLAYKKAEKNGKEALARYKEKAADTQRELMTRYQESRKKGVEGRHKTEMRHKIKNVVSELNQYLLRGNKDRHVPIELQKAVAEALDAVNMDTVGAEERIAKLNQEMMSAKTPEKVQEISRKIDHIKQMGDRMDNKLKALKAAYDKFTDSDDPLIANSHDEVISSKIESVIESVGSTPLRDMNLRQLEDVYDMYRMVLTTVRNANKAFKTQKSESIAVLGNRVMMEVDKIGNKKAWRTKAGDSVSKFAWNSYKPVFAFERIGSKTLSNIYESVRAGEDVWATDVTEAKEFYREQSKKYHYDSWDFGKRYDFRSSSGKNFSLSLDQIMSLYAYSKREQAAEHLKRGGIVFDETTEVTMKTKLGIKVKFNPMEATAYNLSDETLYAIIKKLTPEQIAFVDVMQDYLSTTMGEKGNEVSLELYGIKLFKEKHYFPLKSAPQFMAIAKEQQQGTVKIKNSGFSKETVQKASNPIVLTPFMDVWSNHVNEMSMYHAFVLPMEDFYRVYNYKTPTDETMATESVEMFIQNAYGKGATQYIDQLLKDLNGGARTDPRAGIMTTLIGKFKKSAVFASASVVVQQPSAIARALSLVDAKYFVGKMTLRKHSQSWAEVKKYAPVAIIKEMGYFDTNMGMQTTEWMTTKEYSGFTEKAKALFTDSNFRDEMLSKAPALADEMSWCYIWEAVKRETRATTKLQPGTEEFLAKAGERFTEVVVKTQVYDSVLARSGLMRSKDTGLKMATAFMAEPTTSLNMIADAIVQGKRGNKAYAAKTLGAVAASMILNSILVSFVYAGRDDDEDKTYAEKYIGTLTEELLDSFNPLTLIPFVKDVVSIFQGYDVERSDMAVVTDLVKAWNNLSSDNRSVYRKVEDFAGAIASIFGLPVKNIMRDARAMYNTVNSFLGGEQTTGAGIKNAVTEAVTGKEMSKSDKLYDAMESGDSAMLDRIESQYKDQDAFEIAVRQALRGEYEEGDLSDSQAVDMLVDYGGKAEDEAIAMVMYWAFKQDNPDLYVDDSWISEYYHDGVAEAGISIETFVEYRNKVKDITGEGKKERRMAVIHSMPITNTQKDALYLAEGWTESRLYEAPWH